MALRSRPATLLVLTVALVASCVVASVGTSGPAAAQGTVTVSIQGKGTVTGPGITCTESAGSDCSEFYANEPCEDTPPPCFQPPEVELTAAADRDGFVFDHFDDCPLVSGRTCTLLVSIPRTVSAVFRDVAAPSVGLTDPPNGLVLGPAVPMLPLGASATDNAGVVKVEFLVRDVMVLARTSPPFTGTFNTSSLAGGPATVRARAYDAAGNVAESAARTVTIDRTPPSVVITGPDGDTFGPGSTQTWAFSVSDLTSVTARCSVTPSGSAASFGPCSAGTAGHSVTDLPGGTYELRTEMTDAVGNVVQPSRRTFVIDATPPETSVVAGPADGSVLTTRSVSFGVTSDDVGADLGCRLYRSGTAVPAFAPCPAATPFSASGLQDGSYVFEARAVDAVGNVDPTPVARTFSVDATPPALSVAKKPKRVVKVRKRKAKVRLAFSSEPGSTLRCSLDGAAYTPCASSVAFKVKTGKHRLSVVAVDAAGNASPTLTISWKVKRVHKRH
jgi:hypothetical protein